MTKKELQTFIEKLKAEDPEKARNLISHLIASGGSISLEEAKAFIEKPTKAPLLTTLNEKPQIKASSLKDGETTVKDATLNVYQWACLLTTEQKQEPKYFWTQETRSLLYRLLNTYGNNIAVIGLQGSGKTALKQAIQWKLEEEGRNVYSFKWASGRVNLDDVIRTGMGDPDFLGPRDINYLFILLKEAKRQMGRDSFAGLKLLNTLDIHEKNLTTIVDALGDPEAENHIIHADTDRYTFLIPRLERLVGRTKTAEIKNDLLEAKREEAHTILFDLPDYARNNRSQMNGDLTAIQDFWEKNIAKDSEGEYNQTCNFVIFFQKELFYGHFFLRKLSKFNLNPLTSDQLITAYRLRFDNTDPFMEDALKQIGYYSRGIFRWFKKYIRICLDKARIENVQSITKNHVKQWINLDELIEDMELELMTIFPRAEELRQYSAIILRELREKGPLSQDHITNTIFDGAKHKAKCSRVLSQLERKNYIIREYEGKTKIVRLKGGD